MIGMYSNTQLRTIYIDINIVDIEKGKAIMMKLRIRKMHFSLLFFEHGYLIYYNRLTSGIFYTYRQYSDLVNGV